MRGVSRRVHRYLSHVRVQCSTVGLRKFERELLHQVANDGPSHFVTSLDTDAVLSIDPADCRNASTIRFLFDGTSTREVATVKAVSTVAGRAGGPARSSYETPAGRCFPALLPEALTQKLSLQVVSFSGLGLIPCQHPSQATAVETFAPRSHLGNQRR